MDQIWHSINKTSSMMPKSTVYSYPKKTSLLVIPYAVADNVVQKFIYTQQSTRKQYNEDQDY